jgi:hypothetical protein
MSTHANATAGDDSAVGLRGAAAVLAVIARARSRSSREVPHAN